MPGNRAIRWAMQQVGLKSDKEMEAAGLKAMRTRGPVKVVDTAVDVPDAAPTAPTATTAPSAPTDPQPSAPPTSAPPTPRPPQTPDEQSDAEDEDEILQR